MCLNKLGYVVFSLAPVGRGADLGTCIALKSAKDREEWGLTNYKNVTMIWSHPRPTHEVHKTNDRMVSSPPDCVRSCCWRDRRDATPLRIANRR
jgi:hypothetical protein